MDPVTILVAQLAGPAILAVGLGIFFSKDYYIKVYRSLENETLAVMMGGLTILIAGIALVLNHNLWDSLLAGIVSAIGWLSILKGLMLILFPKTVNTFGDMVANSKFFNSMSILAVLCGGYLSYVAYLA